MCVLPAGSFYYPIFCYLIKVTPYCQVRNLTEVLLKVYSDSKITLLYNEILHTPSTHTLQRQKFATVIVTIFVRYPQSECSH